MSSVLPLTLFTAMSLAVSKNRRTAAILLLALSIAATATPLSTPIPPALASTGFQQSLLYLAMGIVGLGGLPLLSRRAISLLVVFIAMTWASSFLSSYEVVDRGSVTAGWAVCVVGAVFSLRQPEILLPFNLLPPVSRRQFLIVASTMSLFSFVSIIFIPWREFFLGGRWRVEQARQFRLTSRIPANDLADWQLTVGGALPRPVGLDRFAIMDEVPGYRLWRRCYGTSEPDPGTAALWPSGDNAPRWASPCGTK